MTNAADVDHAIARDGTLSMAQFVLRVGASSVALVMLVAITAEFLNGHAPGTAFSLRAMIILGVLAAGIIGALWVIVNSLRRRSVNDGPAPARERFSNRVTLASVALGIIVGVAGATFDVGDDFTAGTLDPRLAIALAALSLIAAPLMTFWWLRRVDEHERNAYNAGAAATGHFLLFVGPAWLALDSAGLLAFDLIIFITIASFIWVFIWMRRRFF